MLSNYLPGSENEVGPMSFQTVRHCCLPNSDLYDSFAFEKANDVIRLGESSQGKNATM